MRGPSSPYVLALRRDARDVAPADWQERVLGTVGVSAGSAVTQYRMQIEVDQEALAIIRAKFGGLLLIEPVERRSPYP